MAIDGEESHGLLRAAIDAVPRAVVITTASGEVVLWSAAAERLLGWREDEVVGRSVLELVDRHGADGGAEPFAALLDAGEHRGEHAMVHRDGRTVSVSTTVSWLPQTLGGERLVVAIGEDSRDAQALQLQRERLELVTAVNEALEDADALLDLMRRVARAIVPDTADWCGIYVFEGPHDRSPLVEVAHRDPAMVRLAREVIERHPYDPDEPNGIAEVIRTRRPAFHPIIDEDMIARAGLAPEVMELVRGLSLRSTIAVPLVKRGRVFGALQLVMTHDRRSYSEDDLALAEVLAGRIASTLDNRRLRDERARTARTDAGLARLGRRLAASATEGDVLAVILEDAPKVLDAEVVAVGLQRDAERLAMHGFPEATLDVAGSGPVAEALRRADTVLLGRDGWAHATTGPGDPDHDGALVASPLFDDVHQTMGVLLITWDHPVEFDEEDLNTVETLSRLCGQAIVRSQLASHTAAMAELAARMAGAQSTEDVAVLLREHSTRHLGTVVASLRTLDSERSVLLPATASELPDDVARRYERVPLHRSTPITDAVRANRSVWVGDLADHRRRYPDVASEAERLGLGATAAVPLHHSDGTAVGAVALAWPAPMRFDDRFRSRVTTVCDLAGQTLERVRLSEAEHAVVASMQHRLLGALPTVPGVELAARYEPAASTVGMGGDWYEATVLPDGTVLAVIGDVVGHGVEAVAAMAQIQHLLTGLISAGVPPEELFAITNAMIGGPERTYATAVLLHVDPAAGQVGYLSAGHPYALVRLPDASVVVLDGNQQPMMGLDVPRASLVRTELPPGSLVLAYTDGLIERRGEPIDDGVARLADQFAAVDPTGDLDAVLQRLVDDVHRTERGHRATTDDIAVMLVRLTDEDGIPA